MIWLLIIILFLLFSLLIFFLYLNNNSNFIFRHIKSHLDGKIDVDEAQMTNEQLQFHYFKMHDSNDDNKLDGVELVKAITHFHDEGSTFVILYIHCLLRDIS